MQSKAFAILITGMILLLLVTPALAYDYQGVPRPGENNADNSLDDSLSSFFSGNMDSSEISSIVSTILSLILYFIFQMLGISTS